ncbi:MAG TPA: hypothetical protein VL527_18245 [Dongiaceae bacterium]|nr:hypothetical protein [Dongiaceae bacterium]
MKSRRVFASRLLLWLLFPVLSGMGAAAALAGPLCRIEVVEKGSGWPVPLVELRTTHLERFVTDNAGVIAFDLPELMGHDTWFEVRGQGYEVPADGFGFHGVRLKPEPGATLRVEVNRTIIARRLGRLTGGGLFAESQKMGAASDWPESGVLGCDSVQNAVYRGRLFWLWGDTTFAHYPLGVFDGTGASTAVQPLTQLQPPLNIRLNYYTNASGAPRGIAPMPGKGPTWVTGCVTLPDHEGQPRLVGCYMKIQPVMSTYEWGLCVWNDSGSEFDNLKVMWTKSDATPQPPHMPEGHAFLWKDDAGKEWVMFGNPFPTLRCPATFEAWQNPTNWEQLTPPATLTAASGATVKPHSGAMAWNAFRHRWVAVFTELFGKPSAFGEVWYAEAKTPTGPWGRAVKVLSHDNYTFYNPQVHPEFTTPDSPVLIFEGTYSQTFADHPEPTPRYDYNQMLYRLDLDDPALKPAQE